MKKNIILFDLDGTLLNTEEGISKCVRYALEKFGIQEENQKKIRRFIGPPLFDSFQREYGFSEEDSWKAVAYYRERYDDIGVWECKLYPQVEETLQKLSEQGYRIGVASSKPEKFCPLLMKHFGIDKYFEVIGGATSDGKAGSKAAVLEDVLKRFGVTDKNEVVLIGDTRYDALGAKEVGIDCIGITYGFEQDMDSMREAGAHICDTLEEVMAYLEE
ncbi:MAG: HAD hydrolase-like protein [Clostridiales bacterium]|nr:HAD hydrolase-like protein [Clostridiales bacterium]